MVALFMTPGFDPMYYATVNTSLGASPTVPLVLYSIVPIAGRGSGSIPGQRLETSIHILHRHQLDIQRSPCIHLSEFMA